MTCGGKFSIRENWRRSSDCTNSIYLSVCWPNHCQWQPIVGQCATCEQSPSVSEKVQWTLLKQETLFSHCLSKKVCVTLRLTNSNYHGMTNQEFKKQQPPFTMQKNEQSEMWMQALREASVNCRLTRTMTHFLSVHTCCVSIFALSVNPLFEKSCGTCLWLGGFH